MERRLMHLFERKPFKMASGGVARYTIQSKALSDEDMATLAWLISEKGDIREVYGVTAGGRRLADALEKYCGKQGVRLIVDDVLTTGASMEAARLETGWHDAVGVVIFARGPCPDWVLPIFSMEWINTEDVFPASKEAEPAGG
jgi:hypothetical protein